MVQCRINKFLEWIQDKNKFAGVTMVRIVINGKAHDYTKWKFSGQNIFFFDENEEPNLALWTTDPIKIIDDNTIVINDKIGLEVFYGGAIL
jgi:hypothetical protein